MIEAATPMKPKKGAEEGQRSETAASNTVDSILFTIKESKPENEPWKRGNVHGKGNSEGNEKNKVCRGRSCYRNEDRIDCFIFGNKHFIFA